MKLTKRIAMTAAMVLASGVAWGHGGHEAIGDGLHIEYLFAAGAAGIVALYALMGRKGNGQD
ncbi:hypothetical protein LPB19_16945 [Marinobacter salinisoli]|uniref:Uncharacterized protein n=1 Tax=Marinobacter salinisoli TaxID=2769486 RepID=A0ABX7MTL9_9GAMM|nr:hypothetical protein [Marinobacter salinisoli]QSP94832.1 hypothetical protein LPB19_16945 [Marinobacter salinisoli]